MMSNNKYSVSSLLQVAHRLKETLPSHLNPVNNLEKLLESHKHPDPQQNEDASNFFYHLLNFTEDFFQPQNMPPSWSIRAYSNSMESLLHVLKDAEVKSNMSLELGEEVYEDLLSIVDGRRKKYMADAKKEARHKKEDIQASPAPLQVVTQLPVTMEQPVAGGTVEPEQPVVVNPTPPPPPENKPNNLGERVKHLTWILHRYKELEEDKFKGLILDLMLEEVQGISLLM